MILSIITVNLNNRDGLRKTIDSVVSQSFTDYEWIIIDGGSTDGSRELIEQYQDRLAYWCSEPDKGIYNAMNKGIDHAKGEWLQFLNSGDWLYDSSTLERVFEKETDADVLYGDAVIIFKDNYQIQTHFPDHLALSYIIGHPIRHQASFYKHFLFETYRYDESYKIISDAISHFDFMIQGKLFKHLKQFIVYFDGEGLSSKKGTCCLDDYDTMITEHIPYHIWPDVDEARKWEFMKERKTLRWMERKFYKKCCFVNLILRKIEILRYKRKKTFASNSDL